ncbi:Ferrochelatase [Candidatus Terasakiella magnetica]|uniref:Ferrochelatase n=1 Tax=Candidatus Terasakiella magnetica TaxID=1867952 RepID=A0A1C3RGG0_9PROT|nr:ferrochelatase [Candidatus Terasakiella magnetica]SCA56345.1 Ferrochelatase [Candidatus Terasakiella magnetica]
MKLAIVLFNLGGPDSVEAIEPFLFNLFNDKAIIGAPQPIRWMLARYISSKRAPVAAEIYDHLGGKSPLLKLTKDQGEALKTSVAKEMGEAVEVETFISMRYWYPMSEDCAAKVKEYEPDHIVLLPLYPQFSTTTSESSINEWHHAAKKAGISAKTTTVCCYPTNEGFISAVTDNLRSQIEEATYMGKPRILFSAHGLPKKIIEKGDPYQWQVEQSALAVVEKLNMPNLDWWVTYQSRVGPLEWIGPNTEDEIIRAGQEKRPLIIVPIAFVSEHSETLVELDIEYKELALSQGVPLYLRSPAVATHPFFIDGLRDLVINHISIEKEVLPEGHEKICPHKHTRCICKG